MLIDCPACARSYHVTQAEIGEGGRTVVCPRCDNRWFVLGEMTNALVPSVRDLPARSYSTRPSGLLLEGTVARNLGRSVWQRAWPVAALAACLALSTGIIAARQTIVQTVPRLAGLYEKIGMPVNLRGLEIAALTSARPNGVEVAVSGAIRNVTRSRVPVPRLVYEVHGADGATLVTWTEKAPAKTLSTGRTVPFVSMPHQLPPESRSVLVHFESGDEPAPVMRVARGTN